MKAAQIFLEMRGQAPFESHNIVAHTIYKMWRAQRDRWLSEDSMVINAATMLGTDQLAAFAALIYATGMTSDEEP